MTHDDQATVRARFNRRFALWLHAAIALIISAVLFFLVFTHPLNVVLGNGQEIWAGYARPDLMYAAILLLGTVGIHGISVLWREGKLNRRTMFFPLHVVSAVVCIGLVFTFFNSWYFNEAYKWVDLYVPASPESPSSMLILIMLLLTVLLTTTLPFHGIWLLYQKMLARRLQNADEMKMKRKREEMADDDATQTQEEGLSVVGDDGELREWAVREMKAKRPS